MIIAEPWEKRESETAVAFAAFRVYRDMGSERSLAKVSRLIGKNKEHLERWSKRHDWVARIHQYDLNMDRQNSATIEKERRDMLSRHARAAVALQSVALKSLQKIKAADLTTSNVPYYLDIAVRMERQARGVDEKGDETKQKYIALWERLGGAATGTEG